MRQYLVRETDHETDFQGKSKFYLSFYNAFFKDRVLCK